MTLLTAILCHFVPSLSYGLTPFSVSCSILFFYDGGILLISIRKNSTQTYSSNEGDLLANRTKKSSIGQVSGLVLFNRPTMSSKTWFLYLSLLCLQACQHCSKPSFSQSGKMNSEIQVSYLYTILPRILPRKGRSIPFGGTSKKMRKLLCWKPQYVKGILYVTEQNQSRGPS